jgi:hypothetical protein
MKALIRDWRRTQYVLAYGGRSNHDEIALTCKPNALHTPDVIAKVRTSPAPSPANLPFFKKKPNFLYN